MFISVQLQHFQHAGCHGYVDVHECNGREKRGDGGREEREKEFTMFISVCSFSTFNTLVDSA